MCDDEQQIGITMKPFEHVNTSLCGCRERESSISCWNLDKLGRCERLAMGRRAIDKWDEKNSKQTK